MNFYSLFSLSWSIQYLWRCKHIVLVVDSDDLGIIFAYHLELLLDFMIEIFEVVYLIFILPFMFIEFVPHLLYFIF